MNAIEWTFKMVDKMSGPAKTASLSIGDLVQTTHSALASIQLIGQAAVGAGRMIAAGLAPAISREKSLGAFETLLGSAKEARDMYGQAVKFAAETPFETAQVVESFQRLLTARFSKEEVPIAMRIIGDAASMQEDSQMAVASVTRALSQIRSKGNLQGEELMQLQEAVPLNTAELYERLGKIYGKNAAEARKMQEAGQIDSQVASFAILAQLQAQFGGNMERSSKQIDGLLSTLKSRPSELLSQLQDTKGYTAVAGALSRLVTAFDDASPAGQRLQEMIKDLGGGALERVAVLIDYISAGGAALFEGLAAGLGPMNTAFGPANQTNLEKFSRLMEGVGTVTGKLVGFIGTLGDGLATVWNFWTKIGEALAKNEKFGAFLDKFAWLISPMADLAVGEQTTGTSAGTTGANLIRRSQASKGLDIPKYGDGGHVTRPHLAIVGDEPEHIIPDRLLGVTGGASGTSPLALGGRPSIQISMPITVMAGGEAGASIGESIMAQVEPALLAILERWQLQAGR